MEILMREPQQRLVWDGGSGPKVTSAQAKFHDRNAGGKIAAIEAERDFAGAPMETHSSAESGSAIASSRERSAFTPQTSSTTAAKNISAAAIR